MVETRDVPMRKGEESKKKIIDAAEKLFARKGYANTYVQDVLDELEASGEAAVGEGLPEADSGVPRKVCAVSGIRGSETEGISGKWG